MTTPPSGSLTGVFGGGGIGVACVRPVLGGLRMKPLSINSLTCSPLSVSYSSNAFAIASRLARFSVRISFALS